MDMLKRNLAPISAEAWEEIDEQAAAVLRTHLSARKAVRLAGPKGWDYTAVNEGRLDVLETQKGKVSTGIYKVRPLVEGRIEFSLNRWELDNITRGARDIAFDALEDAARELARFEENAIFNGYAAGNIEGLISSSEHDALSFGNTGSDVMTAISEGVLTLRENFEEGPFALIVGKDAWNRIQMEIQGYPLHKRIEELLGGPVIYSATLDSAVLIPFDHEDLELTVGQDFSIGYQSHDNKDITLFLTESFTFRVLDPALIVAYTL